MRLNANKLYKRLDPKMSVNKLFDNVSCQGTFSEKFSGRGIKFRHFFKRSFFWQSQF